MKKKEKMNTDNQKFIIAELVVEEYRFLKSYLSMMSKLFAEETTKYKSAYQFHVDKIMDILNRSDMKIVDLTNKPYDDGLSIIALNMEDFDKSDKLIISQVIEPLIISTIDGSIIKSGTVILEKIENKEEK